MKKRKSKKEFKSQEDPLGSYTGTCLIGDEEPVQDADDL